MESVDDVDGLEGCSTLELIEKIRKLRVHVKNLRNVIQKTEENPLRVEPQKKKRKREKPFDFSVHPHRHVALRVAYLGWDFQGLASQEDTDETIEAHLFKALCKTCLVQSREGTNYQRCKEILPCTLQMFPLCQGGRTDKGVSAFSQVVSLDLRCRARNGIGVTAADASHTNEGQPEVEALPVSQEINYANILNKVLPKEIRVLGWAPVASNFSARYDCISRTYKYYFPRADLDLQRMEIAAKLLVGIHDFRNFCKLDRSGKKSTVREIKEVSLAVPTSEDLDELGMVVLNIKGRSFIWHQIRCIVAVLFLVGKGLEDPTVVSQLLDVNKHPKKPQYTMAADYPLVLFDVDHDDIDWQFDQENLKAVNSAFHRLWLQNAIKSSMILDMVHHLPMTNSKKLESEDVIEPLVVGSFAKVYRPLCSRPACERMPMVSGK